MLKMEISKNEINMEASGNVIDDISADICTAIKMIYDKLDDGTKECFIDSIKAFIDCKMYSKTEKELDDINKDLERKSKIAKEESKNAKDKVKDLLEELIKEL